ncbi:MAG: DoxX family protein [Dehalococcoidia bacterium]|nr:DoxX family protein [Dehalococcoidia bacterium]
MSAAGGAVRASLWRFEPATWLFVRLVLAVAWVRGGWEKVGDVGWTASPVGAAVTGFLNGAIEKSTAGPHPEVPHWYHRLAQDFFLPNADVFAYLVAYGELLVGIALAIGLLTRFAALCGVALNLAFLWAGTTSTNPPMLLLGLALVFFGHRPGRLGVDGWLLPWLGERVPFGARQLSREALFLVAVVAGGWLALLVAGWATWFVLAVLATTIGVAAGQVGWLAATRNRGVR